MFRKLLDPDNPLMITLSQITDCVFLSLFWVLGCFPLVTLGASWAALYDAAYRCFRQGDKHSWGRFFHSFRRNLKPGIVPGLLMLSAFAGGGWGLIRVWNGCAAGSFSWAFFCLAILLAVAALGMFSLMFAVLSRFENPLPQLLKNTLLLSLAHFPRTLLLGLLTGGAMYLCLRYLFPLFFLPAFACLTASVLVEPIFKPFLTREEAA